MSAATVRAALVALVASVAGIGRVHDYQRYAREPRDFAEHYLWADVANGGLEHIRGWQVSRTSGGERTLGVGRVLINDGWTIRGYMTLNDALRSELAFDDLVEAIRDAYRADPTLGGACSAEMFGNGPDGVQLADAGPVVFCGVLCHSAALSLETWRYAS